MGLGERCDPPRKRFLKLLNTRRSIRCGSQKPLYGCKRVSHTMVQLANKERLPVLRVDMIRDIVAFDKNSRDLAIGAHNRLGNEIDIMLLHLTLLGVLQKNASLAANVNLPGLKNILQNAGVFLVFTLRQSLAQTLPDEITATRKHRKSDIDQFKHQLRPT